MTINSIMKSFSNLKIQTVLKTCRILIKNNESYFWKSYIVTKINVSYPSFDIGTYLFHVLRKEKGSKSIYTMIFEI